MPESTQKSPVLIQASHGPDMALPDPNLDMLEPEKKKRKVENLENHHTDITLDPEIIQEIQEIEPAEIQEITSAEICQDAPVMIGSQDASAQTTNIDSSQDKKEKERQERELKREQEKQEREFTREQEKLAKLAQREAEKLERDQKKKEEKERKEAERQLKKEALDKQREEKKKKLEEEKIQRAEERKRKLDEDRTRKLEEKKQKKEEEKKLKEEKKRLEEQKKLEDKNAKDRSQMKISSFFSKRPEKPVSEEVAEKSPQINTYSNDFLPFFQKLNVTMAKSQALSSDDLAQRKKLFYLAITKDSETPDLSILHVEYGPSPKWTTTDELVKALDSSQAKEDTIYELLRNLPPIKCLQFYENAKPPYVGTWCSEEHVQLGIGAQNPLDTSLTGYDYYYDSDLDWQDEEEGDDIDDVDEGEEDEEDGGEEEWGDFVDNNELTKRQILGPVLVTSTWNDHSPSSIEVFADMKVMMMSPGLSFPLDPKKNYWESSPRAAVPVADTKPGQAAPQVVCFKATGAGPNILTPHKPTIKDEAVVAELVKFIEKNNVFTVGTLAELAKREFKTYTKSILKHTIQDVAFYDKKENVWKIKTIEMQIPPLHHDPHSSHTETRHTSYIKVSSPKLNHLQIHKQNLRMDAEELQKYSTPQSSLNFLSTQIQSRYEDREHTDTKLDQIRRFKHPRSPDDTVIKRGTIGPIEPSENSQLTNLKNSKNSKNSQLKNPQTKNPLKRKATTRRKKKPATKKITSLSAFVKETLGSKKSASAQGLLDYFGGNQLKVDDFISQMASATAKPFVCSDSESQLVGGEEWRLFLESVKLKFPNLSGPKRKSLVRISRRLDELKSLESNGNDVWSQASTQPKDDLTKEEMKWLYDIDDDQIQNDKSFEGEDSSIGLFFCTLSQALDPLDHVNLDMESEGVEGSYLENQEMDLGSLVLNPQKLKSGSSQSVSPDSPDASRSVEAQVAGPKPIASTTPPTFDLIHEVLENLSIIVADSEPELDSYTEKELLELLSHSTVPSTECSRPTTSTKNRKAITSRQFINVPESADIQSSITFLPLRKLNSKCVIGSLDNISDSLDVAVNVESSPIKGESQVIQPAQRAQKIPSLWSPVKIGTLNKPLQHSPAIDSSPIEKQNPEFEDSGPWIHSSIEIRSDTQLLLRSGDREYQNVELPQHTELISQDVEVHGRIELETSLSSQVKLSKIKRSHDLDSIPDSEDEENEVSVVHISRLISREIGPSEITPKKVSVALGPLFLQVPSSPGMEGFIPFDGQNE